MQGRELVVRGAGDGQGRMAGEEAGEEGFNMCYITC